MDKKTTTIAVILFFCFGCGGTPQGNNGNELNKAAMTSEAPGQSGLVFDPLNIDGSALPDIRDLPRPPIQPAKAYTGIIKNNTRYDVTVPSRNSDASIIIPAYGWVEYTAYNSFFNVTVYYDGKPFYCLNIHAHFQNYPFMCKKYDFIAEIVKEQPVIRERPVQPKRRIKKKPKCDQGVEALG
jgi:hypothetical protein